MRTCKTTTGIGLALWHTAAPVLAAEPIVPMRVIQMGEVQYISGGVTKKQRADLEERVPDFRLLVSFVGKDPSAQPTQVSVTLKMQSDAKRTIDLKTSGPMLLMSMPTGRYTLLARAPGFAPVASQFELQPGAIEELRVVLDPAER